MTTLNCENWSKGLFLLDNLFHNTDVWSIVLEFIGVGRSIFYKSSEVYTPWDCDKKIFNLSSHGRGIGCVHKNASILLNRRSVHIDDALWAIGQSCKYMYIAVYDFQHSLECKKFIITNNLLYKIEMMKYYEEEWKKISPLVPFLTPMHFDITEHNHLTKKCKMISLCEAYRRVLNKDCYSYPTYKARVVIENFIEHDCQEFDDIYKSNAHKWKILMSEPWDILNPSDEFDDYRGWFKPIVKCKGCLRFLNYSPVCCSHPHEDCDTYPRFFLRPHQSPVFHDITKDFGIYRDILVTDVFYYKTLYIISYYRSDEDYRNIYIRRNNHRNYDENHDDYFDRD